MDSKSAHIGHSLSTLRISNLPPGVGDDDVRALLAPYGDTHRVHPGPVKPGSEARAVRYVVIAHEAAERAVVGLHGSVFMGVVINVCPDAEATDGTPRRAAVAAQTPDDELPSILIRHHYEVASVERADLPGDGAGADWYRYVLSSGRSCITGFHRGSLEEVTEYAVGCAAAFNQRNLTGKSARVAAVNPKK